MTELRHAIEAAANRWMQAWVQRSARVLEESLAPHFALVVSALPSVRLPRADWLQTACTRYVASSFAYRDVQVRELGPGLVAMSSIAEFSARIDGVPRNGPLFIVDIWRQDEGKWHVCARYSSSLEQGSPSAEAVSSLR